MPFLEHLEELRWRIIWSLAALALAVGFGFFVVLRFNVIAFLEAPILPYLHGRHVVATRPTDGLQITMSAAIWIGVVLAFPVVLYQAWMFLAPALYKREKRLLSAALCGGVILFGIGAAFAFGVGAALPEHEKSNEGASGAASIGGAVSTGESIKTIAASGAA